MAVSIIRRRNNNYTPIIYRGTVPDFPAAQALPGLAIGHQVWVANGGANGNGAFRAVIFDTTTTPSIDPAASNVAWSGWFGEVLTLPQAFTPVDQAFTINQDFVN